MSKIHGSGQPGGYWLAIILISRFLAGRDLDGERRTNATFLRHADRDLTPHGRAGRWAHKRHAERAAWRTGTLAATLAALYGLVTARHATLTGLAAALGCAVWFAAWRGAIAIRRARHVRRVVRPLYQTVAPLAGLPPGDDALRYLSVPRNYITNPAAEIRLMLSPKWEGNLTQQKAVSGVMARRLAGDWDAYFKPHLYPPYAVFRKAPEPPRRVTLAEFAPRIDAVPENMLALGIGTHDSVISINLDSEAPHVALSMGTGGGKSDTVALIIAALVRKGCERIDVIDPKRVSHSWARGLPNVHIHRYVQGQMTAIRNARITMDSRYDAMDTDDNVIFSRRVLIIEEQNSLMDDLNAYWDEYRQGLPSGERGNVPKKNPAIADLRYLLNKGRQSRVNLISVYQRMSANAAAGGDARENYNAKILARCSPQTWRILVGTNPVPGAARSRIPGRAAFVLGDETHIVQRAYAGIAKPDGSADRAGIARLRAFALNGRPDDSASGVISLVKPEPVTEAAETGLMTLREACESGALTLRYGAAVKARQRDSEFPEPVTHGLYRPGDLTAWQANRLRLNVTA